MIRAYKYRCYPLAAQEAILFDWQRACLEVQRLCVLQRRWAEGQFVGMSGGFRIRSAPSFFRVWGGAWKDKNGQVRERWIPRFSHRKGPTFAVQARQVTELRHDDPFLAACPADVMNAVVRRIDLAWQKMWKDRKSGVDAQVRWAKRPQDIGLQFRGQPERGTVMFEDSGRLSYWKLASSKNLGPLKVRMHRPIPDGADINVVSLTHAADGWYLSFSCEIPEQSKIDAESGAVGVNLNCRHDGERQMIAATSGGKIYQIDDISRSVRQREATFQKLVAPDRKVRGGAKAADPKSMRTAKRRARIARIEQRTARQLDHQRQFVARRIVDTAPEMIALEDTNYAVLKQRRDIAKSDGVRMRRITNRSMDSAAPGRVRQLIEEKAATSGRDVHRVSATNISQTCSACGHVLNPPIGLDIVRWSCPVCGAAHQRDINAALNVRRRI